MATQEQVIRRDFVGVISSIAEVRSGWEVVTEKRPGMQYPDKFDLADSQKVIRDQLKVGLQVCLILQRKGAHRGKEGSPHSWDYYEGIVGLKPVQEAQTQVAEAMKQAGDGQLIPIVLERQPTPYEDTEFRKRRSIERQKAAEIAFNYAAATKPVDQKALVSVDVLRVAEAIFQWIASKPEVVTE